MNSAASGSRRPLSRKGRGGDEDEDDVDLELLQREYRNLQATRSALLLSFATTIVSRHSHLARSPDAYQHEA